MAHPSLLLLTLFALSAFPFLSSSATSSPLGVNYGTLGDDLPSPADAVKLLKSTLISKVKLFSVDPGILRALGNSGLEVMVGIGNDQIKPLASGVAAAKIWVQQNVLPYVPATKITYLSVGNEVLSIPDGEMIYDLQFAMENLHTACNQAGLNWIKVTTPHSMGLLQSSVPPSNGTFGSGPAAVLVPILSFLARTGSPYLTNAYPFFGFLSKPNSTNLEYALFQAYANPHYDRITGLKYTNMFDAQVDAIYAAIARLGFHNITVAVGETGWPSQGDPYEPGVSLQNAKTFNTNLVKHVLSGKGTPLKPNVPVETYVFALFNENLKTGAASEKNYGLFRPDMSPVYDCGIMKNPQGVGGTYSPVRAQKKNNQWCVARPDAANDLLQAAVDWACRQPGTDCTPILPNQSCFNPNTLSSHASYVMNSYYQSQGRHPWNCDFRGSAVVVYKNPSYGSCVYKTY